MDPIATINVRHSQNLKRKILVELDAAKFERLAANLGFFNEEFSKSLEKSEKDFKLGKIRKIKSLKQVKDK